MSNVIDLQSFCRTCGAHVPPRDGEGTCPRCDPACAMKEIRRLSGIHSTEKELVEDFTTELFINHDRLHKMFEHDYREAVRRMLKKHNLIF